jgi:ABC-type multidrug transport system ATPase subunit
LDEVLPSEWGTKRNPFFCLFPSFWRRLIIPLSDHRADDFSNVLVESSAGKATSTVRILQARKIFGQKAAVNGITTDLYPDQITVLLGHNGAGKTTTINMLTGMMSMTSGDCVVYGQSVRTDLSSVRRNMGLCPQHNILWPQLTCWEHLDFYAAIKGVSGAERERAITEMLSAVGLVPETHKATGTLSGGQKRKLSVAIAFIGGSQLKSQFLKI